MVIARHGFQLFRELPNEERIVAMLEYKEKIYVATERGLFCLHPSGDKMTRILFEIEK